MYPSCSSTRCPAYGRILNAFQKAALWLGSASFVACSGPRPALTAPTAAHDRSSTSATNAEPNEALARFVDNQSIRMRVYVTNLLNNTVTTYKANGDRTVPTIRNGIDSPRAIAVDAHGKIYVVNDGDNSVTTYLPNGVRTTPTISGKGLNSPVGIAMDAKGKIFVTNYGDNTLTAYDATGKRIKPTITLGLNKPYGVAVDARGRIYVTNLGANDMTTYNPDGTRAAPTIKRLNQPTGVAVGSNGKIYIASLGDNMLLTYEMSGNIGRPIISTGIGQLRFVTLNSDHDIYVVNYALPPPNPPDVAVYSPHGKPKTNITTGLNGPVGIAISSPGS
jgi:YVTN family beta-propeller protein